MIKVSVIEDQLVIRNGLVFMIGADDNFLVNGYSSAEEALKEFSKSQPDVVLMDIKLPGINGIEATQIIKEKFPEVQVMMCTVFEDDEKIFKALAAGASGYVLKKSSPQILLNAIRELKAGGAPMSSQIARKLVEFFRKPKVKLKDGAFAELTLREKEILQLLSEGYRNKDIAEKLSLSMSTIRSHIYNMYEKLHVHSISEALYVAGKNKLV